MRTIYKYEILSGTTELMIPTGAQVLSVQIQREMVCLWALVDLDQEEERRVFWCYGTGHTVDSAAIDYIGTLQMDGGTLVWHVFEKVR